MLEYHHTSDCPFCGVPFTTLHFRGKAITGIKHPRFEQDQTCRGTAAVDPSHHRHMLITNYERLAEHLGDGAFVRNQQHRRRLLSDFGFPVADRPDGTVVIE